MVSEKRPTSKVSVASVAPDANDGECARRACHTVATRLVTDMFYITPTTFITCIKYEPFRHCISKVSYHVIISFDIVLE